MTTEWEPENDKYYYGEIPENINEILLQKILAKGLKKLIKEETSHGIISSDEDLSCTLDLWFDHDDNGEQLFSHIVSDEWEDERTAKWFEKTVKMARKK